MKTVTFDKSTGNFKCSHNNISIYFQKELGMDENENQNMKKNKRAKNSTSWLLEELVKYELLIFLDLDENSKGFGVGVKLPKNYHQFTSGLNWKLLNSIRLYNLIECQLC